MRAVRRGSSPSPRPLPREHARDWVRVNVVAPGITRTGLHDEIVATDFGEKVWTAIEKSVPLGRRAGSPNEISPAVVFLACDAARFITGQVISVNGGLDNAGLTHETCA